MSDSSPSAPSSLPSKVSSSEGSYPRETSQGADAPLAAYPAPPPLSAGLYIVATPIGNLRDITLRARDALAAADLIVCEDTRVTGKLLHAFGLKVSMLSYHEHNAAERRPRILAKLAEGAAVALVSDAGTPLISDPGYKLVQAAREAGHPVTALPGASAVLTALMSAGLPTDRFFFQGFLPNKRKARRDTLGGLAGLDSTLVFYESPNRLAASLRDMANLLGEREAVVARELTKRFETVSRGALFDLAETYAAPPKGEVVVLVAPPAPVTDEVSDADLDRRLETALATQSLRDAVATVVQATGAPRKRVYQQALAIKDSMP